MKTANQNAVAHSFAPPNVGCAAQCVLDFVNYNACYNACVNPIAVVQTGGGGSAYTPSVTDISGSKPVVDPKTGKTITSGTGVEPSSPPQNNSGFGTSSSSGQITSTPGSTSPIAGTQLANVNWQDVGIRAGLVIGGSILVIVGVVKLFGGEKIVAQMNQPMNNSALPRRNDEGLGSSVVTGRKRTFVETRTVGAKPENITVRQKPDVVASAAGAP